jgi:multimeric flavodoxin WrbA
MNDAIRILGINASPRVRGSTRKIVDWVLEGCESSGAETELINLGKYNIEFCKGCARCFIKGECRIEDDISFISNKMIASDGFVFGSPVHVFHLPGIAKAFMDRSAHMAHRPPLIGKYFGIVTTSTAFGMETVVEYLEKLFSCMGAESVGDVRAHTVARGKYEAGNEIVRGWGRYLGSSLIGKIERYREGKEEIDYTPPDFMIELMRKMKDVMHADIEFWRERGWDELL